LEVLHYSKKETAMSHQEESAVFEAVTAILIEHGPAAMASAFAVITNCAMPIEREQVLKAGPTAAIFGFFCPALRDECQTSAPASQFAY
jgi:hypothetical protein